MWKDRLTPLAERIAHSKVVDNYIIRTRPGYVREIFEEIHPLIGEAFRVFPILERIPSDMISYPARVVERFNIVASILPRDLVFDLAEDRRIEAIYHDKVMWAFGFPTVEPEWVYTIRRRGKEVNFTTTYYTRYLLGLNEAHGLGYWGSGIKVAVVDTGYARAHEQLRGRVFFETAMPGQYTDLNGHGCIQPDAYVIVSNPGMAKIEELYNRLPEPERESEIGYTKVLSKPITTYSIAGKQVAKDRILALHKVPVNGEVIEITTLWGRKLKLTPWHPTPVIRNGEVLWVRADEVKEGDYIPFVAKPLEYGTYQKVNGKTIDEDLAWLIGYTIGDGSYVYSDSRYDKEFNVVTITDKRVKNLELAKKVSEAKGYPCTIKGHSLYIRGGFRAFMNSLDTVCKANDRAGAGIRYYKKVPEIIKKSPVSVREAFVAGLFDAEGWVWEPDRCKGRQQKSFTVKIVNSSEELCKGVVELLHSLGIPCGYKLQNKEDEHQNNCYCVEINQGIFIKMFYERVGRYVKSFKKEVLRKIVEYLYGVNRVKREVVILNSDIIGVKVKKVSRVPYQGYFYDMTTEMYNNYYASGTFVHNTWCATCVGGKDGVDDIASRAIGREVRCLGMAPEVELWCIKALGYGLGMGKTSDIIKAVDISIERGVDVISMSLGGEAKESKPEDDPYYEVMSEVVKRNIIPVVAAGNEGPGDNTISSPGDLPQVLTVGAYNPMTGEVADFSSRGPTNWGDIKPDCVAPGVRVYSGTQGLCDLAEDGRITGYSPLDGTSMATPHVAGAVAIYKEIYRRVLGIELTVGEIKKMLEVTATGEKTNDYGWGVPDFERFKYYLSTEYGVEL